MQARFAGTCRRCGGPIAVGDEIFYAKATGTRHADAKVCADGPPDAPAPTFEPTGEQDQALAAFETRKSLAIEAGAGTGKTATLRLLAAATKRRGQYIAFNKAIVTEAGSKMPATVACSTAHALAHRAIVRPNKRLAERLRNSPRMKSTELAKHLRVEDMKIVIDDGGVRVEKRLYSSYLAGVAMRGITRFCQSADLEPAANHVPYLDGIDSPPGARANNDAVARALVPAMRRAWVDLTSDRGVLPFKHDHYLKMWHLSNPRIGADYILFDECQDANPVLLAIVAAQTHAQVVWVGDSQQAIYGFTGAINALERIKETVGNRTFLSQSFRFGPAVADKANEVLAMIKGAELRLTGTESIPSTVAAIDAPDAILCRTNARAVRYFLAALKENQRPHIVGGGGEILDFAKGARDLMNTGQTGHPELACFSSWGEVQEYVEMDQQGGDLRLMVKLIDEFGVEKILEALERMPREENADLIISTAHKAKGREWDSVQLADDFPERGKAGQDELRLLYVAVTRARLALDITGVDLLRGDDEDEEPEGDDAPAASPEAASGPQDAPEPAPSDRAARLAALATAPAGEVDELAAELSEAPRVPVGQLGREITRDEVKALMDYVATTDDEAYTLSRLADGHLYVEKPGGSMYRLSPLSSPRKRKRS